MTDIYLNRLLEIEEIMADNTDWYSICPNIASALSEWLNTINNVCLLNKETITKFLIILLDLMPSIYKEISSLKYNNVIQSVEKLYECRKDLNIDNICILILTGIPNSSVQT